MARRTKFSGLEIADRHVMQQRIAKMKVLEQQKKREFDELQNCTFHPKICRRDRLVSVDITGQ